MPSLSDADWIFILLAVLYLVESVAWIRPGFIVFPYAWGRFRHPASAVRLTGNDFGTFYLVGASPSDAMFLTHPIPISISELGVCGFVSTAPLQQERGEQSGCFFSWDQLNQIRQDDKQLLVDDEVICSVGSARLASALRIELERVARLDVDERPVAIHAIVAKAYDVQAVRGRIRDWDNATKRLNLVAKWLFLWIFPIAFVRYLGLLPVSQDTSSLLWFLGFGLLLWWWSVVEIYLAHRRLYPDRKGACVKLWGMALLSPILPLRARANLAKELFDFVDPLVFAVACFVPDAETKSSEGNADIRDMNEKLDPTLLSVVESCMRDFAYPRLPDEPEQASEEVRETLRSDRARKMAFLQTALEQVGVDADWLIGTHRPEDNLSQSYCPRCLMEFTLATAPCDRCGGRTAMPFDNSSTSDAGANCPAGNS